MKLTSKANTRFLAGLCGAILALHGPIADAQSPADRSRPAVTVLAAGDIAQCNSPGSLRTAELIEKMKGTVLAVGDLAYQNGSLAEFMRCYDPTWGRFKARTLPVPGNHEYQTRDAAGYFAYFGERAGEPGKGYYSVDLPGWHIVAINSNIDTGADSQQAKWLKNDLSHNKASCILAFWHHARYSSGAHGDHKQMAPIWQILSQHHASIVISGHDHSYERLAPLDASGNEDNEHGIRSFIVGTGGARLFNFSARLPRSKAWDGTSWGVLKLSLSPGSYSWKFMPVAGKRFTDSGESPCVTAQ